MSTTPRSWQQIQTIFEEALQLSEQSDAKVLSNTRARGLSFPSVLVRSRQRPAVFKSDYQIIQLASTGCL